MLTYASWGLSKNTNRAYSSGEKRFLQFCLINCLLGPEGDVLPASEGTLIYFASYLTRTVRHSTIKLYLAAVRNLHITAGYGDPLKGKLLLHKVLCGILRYQGEQRISRQPVTPQVLSTIRPVLQSWLSPRDFSMIWAVFNLAFFAFLRCSEFTYNSVRKFRPLFDLSTDCVSFHPTLACPQRMTVQLKSLKRCLQARAISHNHSHLVHPLRRVGYARVLSLSAAIKGSLISLPVRSFAYPGSSFAPSTGQFEGLRPSLSEFQGP